MHENDFLDTEQPVQNDNLISESVEDTVENGEVVEEETAADPEAEFGEDDGSASVSSDSVLLPNYSIENPLPVKIVEDETEVVEEILEPLEVFSLSGTYHGTISDTYLNYFEGIVEKLGVNEHYVIWRSGQYAYNMCYGEDIVLDGTFFSGDCNLVQIYRSSDSYSNEWYVDISTDSLALSCTDIFCYSDLGMYPTVERGATHGESLAMLVAVCVATVYILAHSLFDYIVKYIYRK